MLRCFLVHHFFSEFVLFFADTNTQVEYAVEKTTIHFQPIQAIFACSGVKKHIHELAQIFLYKMFHRGSMWWYTLNIYVQCTKSIHNASYVHCTQQNNGLPQTDDGEKKTGRKKQTDYTIKSALQNRL